MRIIETKPINTAEAKEVMVSRENAGELVYEQKLAVEHLKKFTKLKIEDAKKMAEELSSVTRMSPEILAQIVNLLPKNIDEIRIIFARERFSLKEDETKKILEIIKKYM